MTTPASVLSRAPDLGRSGPRRLLTPTNMLAAAESETIVPHMRCDGFSNFRT